MRTQEETLVCRAVLIKRLPSAPPHHPKGINKFGGGVHSVQTQVPRYLIALTLYSTPYVHSSSGPLLLVAVDTTGPRCLPHVHFYFPFSSPELIIGGSTASLPIS